jgi:hypothetical protein
MEKIKYTKINIKKFFNIKKNKKKYPLNFDFTVKDKKNKNLSSNGIYFITEKKINKIVYIGIMLSKNLKVKNYVHNERLVKHLKTLTLRGSNVGIQATKSRWFSKCKNVNSDLYALKDNIPNKDTGTTSDLNRISYANLNWKNFSKKNNLIKIISNHFNLHYFKVYYFDEIMKNSFNSQNSLKANKQNFLKIIQKIEDIISKVYKPYLYILKKNNKFPFKNENWKSKEFKIIEIKKLIENLSSDILKKIDLKL